MLQPVLKTATQTLHSQLEELMFSYKIMDGSMTFEEYKTILLINYIVHEALEDKISDAMNEVIAQRLELYKRKKLYSLIKDMAEAGVLIPTHGKTYTTKNKLTDAYCLGAMYVFEGATLGGNVIVKKLKQNALLLPYQLNFHYFTLYKDELMQNWKTFCAILNEQPEHSFEESIAGAKDVFNFYVNTSQPLAINK